MFAWIYFLYLQTMVQIQRHIAPNMFA